MSASGDTMRRNPDPVEIEPDAWCGWCGDPLPEPEERHHGRRYCSPRCKQSMHNDRTREAKKAARPMRACLWCGAAFPAWPLQKFTCTPKCSEMLHNWRKAWRAGRLRKRSPWAVTDGGADPDDLAARKRG